MRIAVGFQAHSTMAKGRYGRLQSKKWSTFTLVLSMLFMLIVVLLMLLAFGIVSLPVITDESSPNDLSSFRRGTVERTDGFGDREDQWTEVISWEPRAFIYQNFLSKEECDYLINLAKPDMVKSTVVDSKTGQSKDSRVRTSSGMFLKRGRDKIVSDIEKRIADFTFIPVEILRGKRIHTGGVYDVRWWNELSRSMIIHIDQMLKKAVRLPFAPEKNSHRSDVEEGGETVFPAAKGSFNSVRWWNELSECGKQGLSVKPKMGDALLFWSMRPDASLDPSSLHGGCPVIRGNKWSSTKWMHIEEYKV